MHCVLSYLTCPRAITEANVIDPHRIPNKRSIKYPPKKDKITFGQEITEYSTPYFSSVTTVVFLIGCSKAEGLS